MRIIELLYSKSEQLRGIKIHSKHISFVRFRGFENKLNESEIFSCADIFNNIMWYNLETLERQNLIKLNKIFVADSTRLMSRNKKVEEAKKSKCVTLKCTKIQYSESNIDILERTNFLSSYWKVQDKFFPEKCLQFNKGNKF